jgi:hypothetical protein
MFSIFQFITCLTTTQNTLFDFLKKNLNLLCFLFSVLFLLFKTLTTIQTGFETKIVWIFFTSMGCYFIQRPNKTLKMLQKIQDFCKKKKKSLSTSSFVASSCEDSALKALYSNPLQDQDVSIQISSIISQKLLPLEDNDSLKKSKESITIQKESHFIGPITRPEIEIKKQNKKAKITKTKRRNANDFMLEDAQNYLSRQKF